MKSRCSNPNNPNHKYWAGKGIKVCDRWLKFENFYDDMVLTWKEGLVLDRIDGNKDYMPSNCRWVNYSVSNKNKPKREWKGVTFEIGRTKYRARIRINNNNIKHLGYFDTYAAALSAYKAALDQSNPRG